MIENAGAAPMYAEPTSVSEETDLAPPCERSTEASGDVERADLSAFLTAQRQSVLAIVDGLDEVALRESVLPSGWTPLGMIEHLAHVERFWFQHVVSDQVDELPWATSEAVEEGPFSSAHPADAVLAFYHHQCARSDAVLAATSLAAQPQGGATAPEMADLTRDVRTVVLHVIEETARHAGHLDVARELIDGRTGLGPR